LGGVKESLGSPLTKYLDLDSSSAQILYEGSSGTRVLKTKDQKNYLFSYSKVGFGELVVASIVDKKNALSATEILLKKSLIFFGLLISAIIIISLLTSKSITSSLRELFFATQKVAEGDFNIHIEPKSSDEVGALARNFNLMAGEVSRLLDQTAEKARMENELLTAKTVQETLFPLPNMKIDDITISGFYEPASECGGDWWHYSRVKNKIYFWIGDATGHGAAAALITSAAKSAAIIIEHLEMEPGPALAFLNRSIHEVSKGRLMMTFFIATYDTQTHQLIYSNASHEAPYLLKRSESLLKKKELIPLNEVNSPRIGQSLESKYQQTEIQIEPGDRIFFYTDGIADIQDKKNENWGERRFIKSLLENNFKSKIPKDFIASFSEEFGTFRQSSSLIDDVTFFIIQRDI
nr:SpoIIE family protein phosphatase [Pseudobdellovibrionaceae bacterium]